MLASELNPEEFAPYYANYINKAGTLKLVEGLEYGLEKTQSFFKAIPSDKLEFRYAEGKWTIKEIFQHIIDAERIFAYRALRFSRHDKTPLPGFEENDYATVCLANEKTIESLLNDYHCVRKATISLYKSFSRDMLLEIGTASEVEMSVRAIGFVIVGHENHHSEVIKERYLK